MNKILVIVGHDKIGNQAVKELELAGIPEEYMVLWDDSSSISRVLKLLKKRVLSVKLLFRMTLAEIKRKSVGLDKVYSSIRSTSELGEIISEHNVKIVLLFRAGLIINKKLIASQARFLNIHASRLPEFGGLGTIQKSIDEEAWDQCATLHEVEVKIDSGRIIDTEPYVLTGELSYFECEQKAYLSGITLLKKAIFSIHDPKSGIRYLG